VTKPDSDMQRGVREFYEAEMKRRLSKKPWIADHCEGCHLVLFLYIDRKTTVIPEFAVGCRRVTPGPGYLEALCQDNVRVLDFTQHNRIVTARSGRLCP
jgi:hypothetical protein